MQAPDSVEIFMFKSNVAHPFNTTVDDGYTSAE